MPCSHCKKNGHNRRTCPQLIKNNNNTDNINQTKSTEYSEMIKQQNDEYQKCLQEDIKKQKEKELAEPTINHLRELRLQHFMKT
tara:strand:+ start:390 stop:641 length:252 start_codon:yes stop_codon:yes gene_type:complete